MKNFKSRFIKAVSLAFIIGVSIAVGMAVQRFARNSDAEHKHGASATEESVAAAPQLWTCSMHPNVKLPKFGKCPICFMDLIRLQRGDGDDEGRVLRVSEYSAKLMEIETSPVERRFVDAEVRMVGTVDYDETRVSYISAWVPGRLDRLFVNYTGIPVKKGEHMVEIYSPDLLVAQEELIQAGKTLVDLKESDSEVVLRTARSTVAAAREKLRLLGLRESQIQELEAGSKASDHIVIYAPANGIVIHKSAQEGMYVQTGTRIYTIADLSRVWIKLDAYESDLKLIRYGGEVEFTTEAYPGRSFTGVISFVNPTIDTETRTVKVRVMVENENLVLKPGMFVRAVVKARMAADGSVVGRHLKGKWISPMHPEIIKDQPGSCDVCGMPLVSAESLGYVAEDQAGAPLVIPVTAALKTGKRAVVYVEIADAEKPTYEGREVVLGSRLGNTYVVEEGLKEGERVVTRGNFKIDAELQLRARPSMMSADADSEPEKNSAPVDSNPLSGVPAAFTAQLDTVLNAYFLIQKALADDQPEAAKAAVVQMTADLQNVEMKLLKGEAHMIWMKHLENLNRILEPIGKLTAIDKQRELFAQLSSQIIRTVNLFPVPNRKIYKGDCPMAFDNKGAVWLQDNGEIANPYFGEAMYRCGEIRELTVPAGAPVK